MLCVVEEQTLVLCCSLAKGLVSALKQDPTCRYLIVHTSVLKEGTEWAKRKTKLSGEARKTVFETQACPSSPCWMLHLAREPLSREASKTEKEAGEEWSIWYLSMEVGEKNLDEWSSWCSVIHKAIGQQLVTGDRDSSVFQSLLDRVDTIKTVKSNLKLSHQLFH